MIFLHWIFLQNEYPSLINSSFIKLAKRLYQLFPTLFLCSVRRWLTPNNRPFSRLFFQVQPHFQSLFPSQFSSDNYQYQNSNGPLAAIINSQMVSQGQFSNYFIMSLESCYHSKKWLKTRLNLKKILKNWEIPRGS